MSAYDIHYFCAVPEPEAQAIAAQFGQLGVDVLNGAIANFNSWIIWRMDSDLVWKEYRGAEWTKSVFNFNNPKRNIVLNAGGAIFDNDATSNTKSDFDLWREEFWVLGGQEDINYNQLGKDEIPGEMFDAVTFETIIY